MRQRERQQEPHAEHAHETARRDGRGGLQARARAKLPKQVCQRRHKVEQQRGKATERKQHHRVSRHAVDEVGLLWLVQERIAEERTAEDARGKMLQRRCRACSSTCSCDAAALAPQEEQGEGSCEEDQAQGIGRLSREQGCCGGDRLRREPQREQQQQGC